MAIDLWRRRLPRLGRMWGLSLCLLWTTGLFAQLPYNQRKIKKELQALIDRYTMTAPGALEPSKTPGISAAVQYLGGGPHPFHGRHFTLVSGYSDPNEDCPRCPVKMDDDLMGEIGSVTKSATAAVILRYIGDKVQLNDVPFTLEATLDALAPSLAGLYFNPKATVRQLLDMTSHIADFDENIDYLILTEPELAIEMIETMDFGEEDLAEFRDLLKAALDMPPIFLAIGPYSPILGDPMSNNSPARFWTDTDVYNIVGEPKAGEGDWDYSNTNYIILGEYLQGLFNYSDIGLAYQAKLFDLYDIDILLGAYTNVNPRRVITGWSSGGTNIKTSSRIAFLSSYWSAGGMLGKPIDAARMALAIWCPEIGYLTPYLREQMLQGIPCGDLYAAVAGKPVEGIVVTGYGLGTLLAEVTLTPGGDQAVQIMGNNGRTRGFHTATFYLPQREVGFTIMGNSGKNSVTGKYVIELERDFVRVLMAYQAPPSLP